MKQGYMAAMQKLLVIVGAGLLVTGLVPKQGLAQCEVPMQQENITVTLESVRAHDNDLATYEWAVTYDSLYQDGEPLFIRRGFFEVESETASVLNVDGVLYAPTGETLYLEGEYQLATIPNTDTPAIWFEYTQGDSLREGRTFRFSYSTEIIDTVRIFVVNNGTSTFRNVFDQAFDLAGCDLGGPTASEKWTDLPGAYELSEAYPNPFNPQTQFTLAVARQQQVRVEVFNLLGERVAMLHEGTLQANQVHTFRFEAGDLPSGVYLYRATGETFTAVRQVMLLK